MSKITKKQLEKQVAELQNKINTLTKENAELKAKVQIYESLPGQAGKLCGDLWNVMFPPQPQK